MTYGLQGKTVTKDIAYQSKTEQKPTSYVILIIPNFLARFVQKMYMTKIKLFSVTVNFGFILNVTTLIFRLQVYNFKTMMNPGVA